MAVTENAGGTESVTVDATSTLVTITAEGVYQLVVDLDELVNGDALEIRAKLEVRATGTAKVVFFATYMHDQGADGNIVISPPIPKVASTDLIFELLQTDGTERDFIWSVYEYANA